VSLFSVTSVPGKLKSGRIGGALNFHIALFVPVAIVTVVGGYRRSLVEIHHGIISVSAGL
jgi:hypothetical protein